MGIRVGCIAVVDTGRGGGWGDEATFGYTGGIRRNDTISLRDVEGWGSFALVGRGDLVERWGGEEGEGGRRCGGGSEDDVSLRKKTQKEGLMLMMKRDDSKSQKADCSEKDSSSIGGGVLGSKKNQVAGKKANANGDQSKAGWERL
eukprot:5349-Hanusia_phi.AAC.2